MVRYLLSYHFCLLATSFPFLHLLRNVLLYDQKPRCTSQLTGKFYLPYAPLDFTLCQVYIRVYKSVLRRLPPSQFWVVKLVYEFLLCVISTYPLPFRLSLYPISRIFEVNDRKQQQPSFYLTLLTSLLPRRSRQTRLDHPN